MNDHASAPAAEKPPEMHAAAAQVYATLAIRAAIDKLAHAVDRLADG